MKRSVASSRLHRLPLGSKALGVRRQIILTLVVVLLFHFILTVVRPFPVRTAAALELYGNFHAMGVIVTLAASDDPDGDATTTVEYRTGSAPYQAGFPLSRVSNTRFVGSLFWLQPATTYDVRVTFSDPDGDPLDNVIVTASGATRAEVTIPPPSQSYYVDPNGSGTACTLASPCSLTEGLNQVDTGQEVVLRGGVYYLGELSVFRSGASGAPIVIRGYPGETAILDGADPAAFTWTAQGGGVYTTTINVPDPYLVVADGQRLFPYNNLPDLQNLSPWGLPGFYASGATLYVRLANNADPNTATMAVSRYDYGFFIDDDYIAFVDLTFRHYGRDMWAKAIFFSNASDNLVQGSTFYLNNQDINIKHDSHRNLIQDNEFYDTLFDWDWDAVKDPTKGAQFVESGGIYVNTPVTGRGNVIRRNTFHDTFDGFHVCPIGAAGVTNETDVYENLVYRAGDDGIETDGVCSNVRIWENTIHDVLVGISVSPVYTGPVYALRNVIYNAGAGTHQGLGSPFKFTYPDSSDGAVYLFHNTYDAAQTGDDGITMGSDPGLWDQIVSRNNIWVGNKYGLRNINVGQLIDFDYDDLYTTSSWRALAWWAGLADPYLDTLAEFQTQTGQELNGLNVVPGFADAANVNYNLAANSNLIDAGVVIPGINDQGSYAYQGAAPDIGAYEASPTPTPTPTATATPSPTPTPTPSSTPTYNLHLPIVTRLS
ncbi:MAG: right-handed parallel beta-helix repeat-containing protein [Nitrospiria bacterium]